MQSLLTDCFVTLSISISYFIELLFIFVGNLKLVEKTEFSFFTTKVPQILNAFVKARYFLMLLSISLLEEIKTCSLI